ncbi:hypothetical protein D9619_002428 [Psilocybe cf. subviscida]|uniref:Uncharacterized protein n=1 Tax=Psilocybe cf. subviscida TaxID=2480587 RepID=A0A8H5AWS1_9AGAR|nr:hypothetical protein D9619_002428 [Psilocybe cf. subviscida]
MNDAFPIIPSHQPPSKYNPIQQPPTPSNPLQSSQCAHRPTPALPHSSPPALTRPPIPPPPPPPSPTPEYLPTPATTARPNAATVAGAARMPPTAPSGRSPPQHTLRLDSRAGCNQ